MTEKKINRRQYGELPYDFDLLYDIKTMEQAHRVMRQEPDCSDATPEEVYDLLVKHELPVPDWYTPPKAKKPYAWLDGSGGYQTYEPLPDEAHKFTAVALFNKEGGV